MHSRGWPNYNNIRQDVPKTLLGNTAPNHLHRRKAILRKTSSPKRLVRARQLQRRRAATFLETLSTRNPNGKCKNNNTFCQLLLKHTLTGTALTLFIDAIAIAACSVIHLRADLRHLNTLLCWWS